MNMIRTQEGSFVNLENILQIVPQIFDFGDAVAYVLTAQPNSVPQINNETLDDCIQLCIYDSFDKVEAILFSFSEWLENSENKLFCFPTDVSEEELLSFKPFNMSYKDGIVYWKRENGEVMKIGGSGGGKTRYFRKPDLLNNKA